jgi:cobalamin biosynthesis protein CobT
MSVLDEPEPAPSLTRPEEKRVISAYREAVEDYVIELLARAKGINIDGDEDINDDHMKHTTKFENGENGGGDNTGRDGKEGDNEEGKDDDANEEKKEVNGEDDNDEEEENEETKQAKKAKKAAAAQAAKEEEERILKSARAKAEKGITLKGTRKALLALDMNMNDAQFAKHVETFFREHDLMVSE